MDRPAPEHVCESTSNRMCRNAAIKLSGKTLISALCGSLELGSSVEIFLPAINNLVKLLQKVVTDITWIREVNVEVGVVLL